MVLRVPSYYKEFHCIADQCKDSCCIGWEIDIDEDTFAYYKSVEGAFGKRLAAHMEEGEQNSFTLKENGWCPFLNEKKLCDICTELGEEALSEVCTEFPRFTMEYGKVREKVLSLSCEEVGRILFSSDAKTEWEEQELPDCCWDSSEQDDPDKNPEEEEDACAVVSSERLEAVRAQAVAILQDRTRPVFVRAAEYLNYCERMQQELYGCTVPESCGKQTGEKKNSIESVLAQCTGQEDNRAAGAYEMFLSRMQCFAELEVLDDTWENEKEQLFHMFSRENYLVNLQEFLQSVREREYEYEHLLVYFTFRYFMRAYYDDNILVKAQLAVASVLMIRDMDVLRYLQNGRCFAMEDRIDTAKIYSKEVEHSEENMELLAEDFQFEEVFRTENLIGALLCGMESCKYGRGKHCKKET